MAWQITLPHIPPNYMHWAPVQDDTILLFYSKLFRSLMKAEERPNGQYYQIFYPSPPAVCWGPKEALQMENMPSKLPNMRFSVQSLF